MSAPEQAPAGAPLRDALAPSEDSFRALVEQAIAGIYVIQDGRVVYANPKFCEIFGYSREDFAGGGVTIEELTSEADWPMVRENVRRRIAGEVQSLHYAFRARRKDGALIDVEVHGARTGFGGKPSITGMLLDVTALLLTPGNRGGDDAIREEPIDAPVEKVPVDDEDGSREVGIRPTGVLRVERRGQQ